jgi:predicted Zn finger-like uncharacterized protein
MKFVCDSCGTKYSIADERVRGRVLKIRCKTCDHVITVREERPHHDVPEVPSGDAEHTVVSGLPEAGLLLAATGANAGDDWYVSFDGEQEGPFTLGHALERVRIERALGKEAHGWRPGFFVWLPVDEIPEFAEGLAAKTAPVAPRPQQPPRRDPTGPKPAVSNASGPKPAIPAGKDSSGPKPAPAAGAVGKDASGPKPPLPSSKEAAAAKPAAKEPPPLKDATGPKPAMPAMKDATGPKPAMKDATGPKPAMPAMKDATGPKPAMKDATGPKPAMKDATGPKPAMKDATGPKPAMKDASGPKPLVGAKDASGPKPALPGTRTAAKDSSAPKSLEPEAPPAAKPLPRREIEESGQVSPFAAALSAGAKPPRSPNAPAKVTAPAGGEAGVDEVAPDTGPVPLPPPPGGSDDLVIGEPSGLLNLAHLAGSIPRRSEPHALDTFGGVALTPTNGHAAPPAPVVVVTGPAKPGAAPWVKWSVLLLLLIIVGLGGTVVYLVTRAPQPASVAKEEPADKGRRVEDSPIVMADPAPPTSIGPASPDPKRAPPVRRAPSVPSRPTAKGASLSSEQRNLAALYSDDGDRSVLRDSAPVDRGSRGGGQVSQSALLSVVTNNRRSLNLCYDRVLKHDSSLKRARVVTHIKVGISGSVTGVTVPDPEYANSEIGQCLTQTIKRWHFPASDSEYETELPILLQAQ